MPGNMEMKPMLEKTKVKAQDIFGGGNHLLLGSQPIFPQKLSLPFLRSLELKQRKNKD